MPRRGRKPFAVIDCESDPFRAGRVPVPFIWGYFDGADYREFLTVPELVAFLETKRLVIYAHNGGKFDYHYLKEYVNTGEPISIISGRLSKFRIGECEFRDSMNILPVALRTFKKDDMDYSIMEADVRHQPDNWEKIRRYLRSDCTNLYELISEHRKENGVVLTQASASMRAWSKRAKIAPPRQSGQHYLLYKPFYYGGRVQCFKQGNARTNFQVIDINSAYPYAMQFEHPFSAQASRQSHLPPDGALHKCLITLDCTARGCFPLRVGDDLSGDLYFPHDEHEIRRYHVTGYEFMAALRQNAVKNIRIISVQIFRDVVKFADFIQYNWARRRDAKAAGNKALDIIYKLLMNSLYGKFASDYFKYMEYQIVWTEDLPVAQQMGYMVNAQWAEGRRLMERPIDEKKHRFYNIATAASITGFVRAMLFEAISHVENPIYCDTDSIACGGTGRLHMGEGLGQWKLEGDFDEYSIAGKKTYAFHQAGAPRTEALDEQQNYQHWKVASKGVDLGPGDIRRAADGMEVTYSPEVPTYSLKREQPIFINRRVKMTAKDIGRVPLENNPKL